MSGRLSQLFDNSSKERVTDLVCLGRLAVDLYGLQQGAELEDVASFAKYLGGSSANIAAGSARLGLATSMISRVGDEQFGRFLIQALQKEGCDTSQISIDPERLTGLAILALRNEKEFPLLFYRDHCADMALRAEDVSQDHIAKAKALLITGTHFSTDQVMAASMQALEYAHANNTLCVLDIDYRPVLWGLTTKGDGDTRFIASDPVTAHMQKILPEFDLIVGTEEEFNISGGSEDLIQSLKKVRALTKATLVIKRGASGCAIVEGDVPNSIEEAFIYRSFEVQVLNVLGAGDAFMSGFLFGLLRGKDYEECCTLANACGALVVSRHACSPSMPTPEELRYFLKNRQHIDRIDLDSELNVLHRMTQKDRVYEDLAVLAFDHRRQFTDLLINAGGDLSSISTIKHLILDSYLNVVEKNSLSRRAGVLIDDTWGHSLLQNITGSGLWIGRPVEQPSSRPLELEGGRDISRRLQTWPIDHTVKCLVFYHPDDDAQMRYAQERQVLELYQACCHSGHQLLLEVILPSRGDQSDAHFSRIITRFYNLGVHPHWWKLPPMSQATWEEVSYLIEKRSEFCRGILLLGLNVAKEKLAKSFIVARQFPLCKGFAIGRTIFHQPTVDWLQKKIDDAQFKQQIETNYLELVHAWDDSKS